MKLILSIVLLIVLGLYVYVVREANRIMKEDREVGVLYEGQKIPMPEEYRDITGEDSIQVTFFMGKWEAIFCHPNKESVWMNIGGKRILIYTGYTDSTK